MDTAIEHAAREVLKEAIAEVRGTSNRKWAVALIAFSVGAVLGLFFGAYWNESQHQQRDDEEILGTATTTP